VNLCNKDRNEVPLNYLLFIDGLSIDKCGKIECEAVLCCCGWLKRHARNRSSCWFILGFLLEDIHRLRGSSDAKYQPLQKTIDYHRMLDFIFEEIKSINARGGMKLSVPKKNGSGYVDLIALPQLQFIIGDCKGMNYLAGRYGSHGILVKQLCRDCDVPTKEANLPFRVCNYRTSRTVQRMTEDECKINSFHHIPKNSFWDLPFGGNPGGIYTSTPIEVLHGINLGICMYISKHLENKFTKSFHTTMNSWTVAVSILARRQSERDLHDLTAFRYGLVKIANLTGDEKVARIFMLYLLFMQLEFVLDVLAPRNEQPYFKAEKITTTEDDIANVNNGEENLHQDEEESGNEEDEESEEEEDSDEEIADVIQEEEQDEEAEVQDEQAGNANHQRRKRKKPPKVKICLHHIRTHLMIFERTLCLHAWLKSDKIKKEEVQQLSPGHNSPAETSIEAYMDLLVGNLYLKGNVGMNTTTFHQLKHFPKYVREFGVPQNFDGGILEHHGKEMVKELAQRTNKKISTISQDIAKRSYEQRLIERSLSSHLLRSPSDVHKFQTIVNKDLYPIGSGINETPLDRGSRNIHCVARGARFTLAQKAYS